MHWSRYVMAVAPLAAAAATNSSNTNMVIMDNDWGTVEFPPFLLALKAGWDVLGLVSNTANTFALQCGLHALATLELGGLQRCIPVHKGADWPLLNTPERLNNWEAAYGQLPFQGAFKIEANSSTAAEDDPTNSDPSGFNAMQVNKQAFTEGFPNATFASENGAMYMVEQVRKYPGQVSIFSAGSMTNIALAVRMDSTFAKNAKELVVMGGYLDLNLQLASKSHILADISSDINLKLDPEAAKIALTAEFPQITIVGNAANTVFPNEEFNKKLNASSNAYSNILEKSLVQEFPIWDSVAAAVMIDPKLITNSSEVYLDVNVARDSPSYGNIYVFSERFKPTAQKLQKVRIATEVAVEKVRDMIADAVTDAQSCEDLERIRDNQESE